MKVKLKSTVLALGAQGSLMAAVFACKLASVHADAGVSNQEKMEARSVSDKAMPKADAEQKAAAYLKKSPHNFVVLPEKTQEHRFGWMVFYLPKKQIETGDSKYMVPGSGPLIVDRSTGAIVETGSVPPHLSAQQYEKMWVGLHGGASRLRIELLARVRSLLSSSDSKGDAEQALGVKLVEAKVQNVTGSSVLKGESTLLFRAVEAHIPLSRGGAFFRLEIEDLELREPQIVKEFGPSLSMRASHATPERIEGRRPTKLTHFDSGKTVTWYFDDGGKLDRVTIQSGR